MEHVLYVDVLFFINFSMDFITLYLTSRLTSGPPMGIRSLLSAAIGGIYGTAAVALNLDGIPGVLTAGAVSAGMVALALGYGGIKTLLRRSAVFWGFGALLGGVMTAICSFGGNTDAYGEGAGNTALLFAGSSLCLLFMRLISRFGRRRTVRIRVSMNDRTTEFTALCDSGNLASDPMTARPAILADESVIRPVIPELCGSGADVPEHLRTRIRMIPVKGIDGAKLLTGFVPDSVAVVTDGKERRCDAVIAVADLGSTFFGGYPANAPAAIL